LPPSSKPNGKTRTPKVNPLFSFLSLYLLFLFFLLIQLFNSNDPFIKNIIIVSKNAMKLSAEYMRLFVLEAIHRSEQLARDEGSPSVEIEHLQKILPQLLLDF